MNPHRDDSQQLVTRLTQLEAELSAMRQTARVRRRAVFGAIGVLAFVATLGTALAANGNCPNGLPFCFAADQPALASSVNHNFAQLKEWLEAKAGPITSSSLSSSTGAFSGGLTVAGLLSSNGGLTVSGGALTANAGANVSGALLTANQGLTVNGATIFSGFQTSCFLGVSGFMFPACCRIDIRNGETKCRVASAWQSPSFVAGATDPFAASTADHYSLSCFGGINNVVYPTCCRSNSAGTVVCRVALDWQLNSWAATGSSAF